jgi:hypothetical protein
MSTVKLKYITESAEEHACLQEALSYFLNYLNFDMNNGDNNVLFVEPSKTTTVRTLEGKFMNLRETKGISIYPEKEKAIRGICKESQQDEIKYPIFWFDASKEGLSIGLQPRENKKYLFDVYYEKPAFAK